MTWTTVIVVIVGYLIMGVLDCICYKWAVHKTGAKGWRGIMLPFSGIYLWVKYRKVW